MREVKREWDKDLRKRVCEIERLREGGREGGKERQMERGEKKYFHDDCHR